MICDAVALLFANLSLDIVVEYISIQIIKNIFQRQKSLFHFKKKRNVMNICFYNLLCRNTQHI